jgi:hypothetical protein
MTESSRRQRMVRVAVASSASNRTALQIGKAVGIAVLGDPQGPEALGAFRRA